jgi:hypothetical protein
MASYVRLARSDAVPFAVLPWVVATGLPGPGARWSWAEGSENIAGYAARSAVGHASLNLGRPAIPTVRPPVRTPMILEAWDPAARSYLESESFLGSYAQWESRAGAGQEAGGTVHPVLEISGDEVRLLTGLDLGRAPDLHARTVREVIEMIPRMEVGVTDRDPLADPISTVKFTDPPGSVPDVRPAYPCPRCAKLEILRRAYDPATGLTHARTLHCGFEIFPPKITRARDVFGAAELVIRS